MKHSYNNQQVAVVGYGIEGESVAEFLRSQGAQVTVFDEKNEEAFDGESIRKLQIRGVRFNPGGFSSLTDFDLIVRSPGVSPQTPELVAAKHKRIEITSGTKLFFDLAPCPIIGVTGTKGKGTTSSLIYHMLKEAGRDVYLGGNIGVPPLSFLPKLTKQSFVVLELSSFQLIDLTKNPYIAVVLMTTVEHQDYHTSEVEYVDAKANLVRFQTKDDYAVVNWDYPNSRTIGELAKGNVVKISTVETAGYDARIEHGWLIVQDKQIIQTHDIFIPGAHNFENALAAAIAATLAHVPNDVVASVLKSFRGLIHRLEFVRTIKGVRYYDDSFSTTPETAIAAINAFKEPKVLILGGSSKNSDFTKLGKIISDSSSIRGIVGIGVEWERIRRELRVKSEELRVIEGCKTMREIVEAARNTAKPGDVVLLSPACASFDMFKNYKERGREFKEEVNKIQ